MAEKDGTAMPYGSSLLHARRTGFNLLSTFSASSDTDFLNPEIN